LQPTGYTVLLKHLKSHKNHGAYTEAGEVRKPGVQVHQGMRVNQTGCQIAAKMQQKSFDCGCLSSLIHAPLDAGPVILPKNIPSHVSSSENLMTLNQALGCENFSK
jgi:hypothetical protein